MHNAVYGVAKAALDRLTSDMADDLAESGVTVVSLWPGIVDTELLQMVPRDKDGRRVVTLPGEGTYDLDNAESPAFRAVPSSRWPPIRTAANAPDRLGA